MLESREENSYLRWGCKMVGQSVSWDQEVEIVMPFLCEDMKRAMRVAEMKVQKMDEITRNSLTSGVHMISESLAILH